MRTMPIYEYECARCNQRFERLQRLSDPVLTACPNCGGVVHKMFSVPALQFKGSGFYKTDYARGSSGSVSSEGKARSEPVKAESKKAASGAIDG
jgi:putative FmdB family regulatory protein